MANSLFKRELAIILCTIIMLSLVTTIPVTAKADECPLYGKHKLDGAVMFEAEHPHKQYTVCDCGYAQYTGGTVDYYAECEVCNKQESTCEHKKTEKKVYYDEYVVKDSQYHYHNYFYDVVCKTCGEKISSPMGSDKEAHSFNRKEVCTDCGYALDQPCAHKKTKEVLVSQSVEVVNEKTHKTISTYNEVCSSCKEIVDTFTDTETEAHTFDSVGDCEVCGYRKECKHKSSSLETVGNGYDPIDASQHEYYVVSNRVCDNCGKVLEYNVIERAKQSHTFSGDTCTYCGYKKEKCQHESTKKNVYYDEYITENSQYH